jgi:hypothetical protein
MANTFKIGDKVRTKPCAAPPSMGGTVTRLNGRVKYIACGLATPKGGKTCDKKTCTHMVKDFVWVTWPIVRAGTTTFSYHYNDLEYDAAQPVIPPVAAVTTVADAQEKTTSDPAKEAYLEKAKAAIKDVIKPKLAPMQQDFWSLYNGFDQIKYDRNGKAFIREMEARTGPVIKDDEIDFDVYSGRKKGSVRKAAS